MTVRKRRGRFIEFGVAGLADEPRPGRPPSILLDQVQNTISGAEPWGKRGVGSNETSQARFDTGPDLGFQVELKGLEPLTPTPRVTSTPQHERKVRPAVTPI